MWELDHKEGWVPKNWCFWIVVLEKTLESPLDSKEMKPINPKGNQPWIFIGRTDAEASILWPPELKSWLTGKDPDVRKERSQEEAAEMRWFDGITDSMDMNLIRLQKIVKERIVKAYWSPLGCKSWIWLNDWKTVTICYSLNMFTQNLHVWLCLEMRYLRKWLRFKTAIRVGTCEKRHGELWVPSPLRADQGRAKRGQGQKVARKQPFQWPNWLGSWSCTSGLQNCEKINFYCWIHPVYSTYSQENHSAERIDPLGKSLYK